MAGDPPAAPERPRRARLKDEHAWHQQQADAAATPEPLRQRHWQRAEVLNQIITGHEASRQLAQPHCDTARHEHRSDEEHHGKTTTEGLL